MQSPPLLHPVPISLAVASLALTWAEVKMPGFAAELGPFINTGLLLAYMGWSGRELWKMRGQISSLPGDMRKEIETAVAKESIRQSVAMGAMEQRLAYDIGRLERRVDDGIDKGRIA